MSDNNTNVIVFRKNYLEKPDDSEQSSNKNGRKINKVNLYNEDNANGEMNSVSLPFCSRQKTKTIKQSNLAEKNQNEINTIKKALFTQLGKINIKLKENSNSKGKEIPTIETIELTLLNQSMDFTQLKEYGYNIFVFFLYLIDLLSIFFILLVFAFSYIYNIFYNYYKGYEEEYSLIEDYNILSIVSGVQINKIQEILY